ncbi:FtsQ-type POTRA domain-containing protein [Agromyces larvae]|uniref:FtsQ-type POTRA domain-containing protein n=1 Tax=Agromyces larvae TaxID=2929802 RepID=A0ABY4C052_9MICO|nr:FtsQ-type POTRA domain-containing protein [Agromyces larvae]UOE44873.1 FtsQ-type POTRA domain-containing protein [Agromyces larvae]
MKRPQGFDRPPVRRAPSTSDAPARRGEPAARAAADGASDRARPGTDRDRVTTEPIVLPVPPERGPADAEAAPDLPADGRAARRAVAKAARERRRYEKQEIRRFTQRTRRRRIAWLVAVGSVLLVVGGAVAAAYSPIMALREVRVEGLVRTSEADVVAAFDDQIGTPLALIGSDDVQAALRGFPLIETYAAETVPPGTLVLRVVERTPVGVVQTSNDLALVDGAGVVIDHLAERPEGQPLIEAGAVTSEGFRAAAAVIRSLPPQVRPQVVRATAETVDDVRLELASGVSVVWGSAEQSTTKADVLAALMVSSPDASRYDVSAPMNPVVG